MGTPRDPVRRKKSTKTLSQAEVVVLSLVRDEPTHGYDLVRRIEAMRVRQWAKIGTATVYTVIERLRLRGAVVIKKEAIALGPPKRVVTITARGRRELVASVRSLLRSSGSVYSDRIVGLAMIRALPKAEARRELKATIRFLKRAAASFEALLETGESSSDGALVIAFYRDLVEAEQRAFVRALEI